MISPYTVTFKITVILQKEIQYLLRCSAASNKCTGLWRPWWWFTIPKKPTVLHLVLTEHALLFWTGTAELSLSHVFSTEPLMNVSCLEAKPLGAQSKRKNKLLIKESKYAQSSAVWKTGGAEGSQHPTGISKYCGRWKACSQKVKITHSQKSGFIMHTMSRMIH